MLSDFTNWTSELQKWGKRCWLRKGNVERHTHTTGRSVSRGGSQAKESLDGAARERCSSKAFRMHTGLCSNAQDFQDMEKENNLAFAIHCKPHRVHVVFLPGQTTNHTCQCPNPWTWQCESEPGRDDSRKQQAGERIRVRGPAALPEGNRSGKNEEEGVLRAWRLGEPRGPQWRKGKATPGWEEKQRSCTVRQDRERPHQGLRGPSSSD